MATDSSPKQPFGALQALLATSTKLLGDLLADPLLERVLRAFLVLPAQDREVIVQVLEKDATWRRIAEQSQNVTGIRVRPNPHASLYVHVLEGEDVSGPSERDANVIRLGVASFVAMVPLLFQPDVHALWSAVGREVAATATPEVRRLTAQLAHEVLAMIAEVEGE